MKSIQNIGDRIKELRKELNLSQQELAGDDFTKSYISKIERGLANPSMKALEIIASRLDKSVSFFMNGKDDDGYDPRLLLKGNKLYEERKYTESVETFNEVLQFKEVIAKDQLIRTYHHLADIYLNVYDYSECISCCEEALSIIDNEENSYLIKIYLILGEAYYYIDKRKESLEAFLKSEKLLKDNQIDIDVLTRLELYNDIAALYGQMGEGQLSKKYFETILDISKKEKIITTSVLGAISGLSEISVIFEKNIDKSLQYLDSSILGLYEYFEDYTRLGGIYFNYANIYFEKEDFIKSNEYIEKLENAINLIENNDNRNKIELEVLTIVLKGKLANSQDEYNKAEEYFLNAYKKADQLESFKVKVPILLSLGELYYNKKEFNKAIEYLEKSETIARNIDFIVNLPDIYQLLGKIYIKQGNVEKGQHYYDEAFNILKNN